jgi:hypothetical protein
VTDREQTMLFILPVNVSDILSSAFVQEMDGEQFRWYFRMMAYAWTNKRKNCYLENDDEKLRIFAGCKSKKVWARKKKLVLDQWEKSIDGMWIFNERLLVEFKRVIELIDKRVAAGRKGGACKALANVQQTPSKKVAKRSTKTCTYINTSKEESRTLASRPTVAQPETVVITIPLNDGSDHEITQTWAAEMEKLYPAVDVVQECREMRAWAMTNPNKRKTRSGIQKFCNAWLARAQDQGGKSNYGGATSKAQQRSDNTKQAIGRGFGRVFGGGSGEREDGADGHTERTLPETTGDIPPRGS